MRIIEQLVYKIQGDNSEFDRSIDKSETKITKFGSVADKMLAGVTVAAIGMVVKKMGDMVMASATALDRVDKLSQKIGISRVAFQEWDYILGQSGASVEGLQMGVKTLSNAADEARKGTALYAEAFDRLGVSVTDANGNMKDQETLFAEVFSALADMENQTERTALANKLLGRSATELAPTLNTSKEAIEGLRQEAHDLGLVYSDELVDAGVVLGDNIDRLKKSFEALKTNALAPIIGLAVTFTDKLLGQWSATKDLESSTKQLVTATINYKTITEQLKQPIDKLTESEKALLEIQQARAGVELNRILLETGRTYEEVQRKIKNLEMSEAKHNGTIKDSLAIINKYTPQQREEIRNYQQQGRTVTDMLLQKRELLTAEETLQKAQLDLLDTQGKLIDENANLNTSLLAISQAVFDEKVEITTLQNINAKFAESVMDNVRTMRLQSDGISEANKRLNEINLTTEESIQFQIDYYESMKGGYKDAFNVAMINSLLNTLYAKKNDLLVETAKNTEDANKKDEARNEILENMRTALQSAEQYALALGSSYDLNAQKASILETTIKALIDSGLTSESEAVKGLVSQLEGLSTQTTETGKTIEDVANTNIIPAAQVAFDTWRKEQERTANEAERQAERVKQAWTDATFSMLGSVTSIWGSINQVQANQNEEEIQRIEEQNAIAIQAAKDRGATEEEVTALEKSLQADLNDAKNQYAQEEAERNKALSTLSVILDTAKAIMQIWANPLISPWGKGLWTGLAAGAGAAQIAAINSAPVPSYDVGSIRIPETTTATVHKDEMILTAPQAEQARREGITIAPTKNGGNSVNLVIYLDGKEIARNTIDNLNSGSVGTIKARVVK